MIPPHRFFANINLHNPNINHCHLLTTCSYPNLNSIVQSRKAKNRNYVICRPLFLFKTLANVLFLFSLKQICEWIKKVIIDLLCTYINVLHFPVHTFTHLYNILIVRISISLLPTKLKRITFQLLNHVWRRIV